MRKVILLGLAGMFLLALSCGGGGGNGDGNGDPIIPPPSKDIEWTVMFYMGGDNNLAQCALMDLEELEQVGSTDQVHFTALADIYYEIELLYLTFGMGLRNKDGDLVVPMMHVTRHPEEGVQSHLVDSKAVLYELDGFNSADSNNLRRFIQWSAQRFPANHYALVIWDHGSSWLPGRVGSAAVYDEWEGGGDAMYIHEIEAAIKGSGIHLDLLDFTACNMASIEVAYQLKDVTDYICASQKIMWAGPDGIYETVAAYLTSNPSASAEALGKVFVDTYINTYAAAERHSVTHSLIRTDRLPAVAGAVGQLTPLLTDPAVISSSDLQSTFYEPIRFHQDVDLNNYTNVLPYHVQNAALSNALAGVRSAVNASVVYNRGFTSTGEPSLWSWGAREFGQGEDINVAGATGLNIFLPTERDWTQSNFGYYNSIAFNQATGWSWVIAHAYAGVPYLGTVPGYWWAGLVWSTNVDLDLWIFEPDGYGGLIPASPVLGPVAANGYMSPDSHWTGVSYEEYQTKPKVIWGPYFFLAVYYCPSLFVSDAFCQLALGSNPWDTNPSLTSEVYFISATQPDDPDFGPGVVYFGFLIYDPQDGIWYFCEGCRNGQAAHSLSITRITGDTQPLEDSAARETTLPASIDADVLEDYYAQGLELAEQVLREAREKD